MRAWDGGMAFGGVGGSFERGGGEEGEGLKVHEIVI